LPPVVEHADGCAEAFFGRIVCTLLDKICKEGNYDPNLGGSCLTFAAVEGCSNYESAVERIVKLAIVRSNCTGNSKNKDYENLMCFRGSDSKKTFLPYHNYIDAQLKVYSCIRKNSPDADSKKKLYEDVIRVAKEDVQAWLLERNRNLWKRSLLDEVARLVHDMRKESPTWLKNAKLPSETTQEGYEKLLFNLLLVVQKQKGFSATVLALFGFENTTEHEASHMISDLLCAIQEHFKLLRIRDAEVENMIQSAMTEISATMEDSILWVLPEKQ